MTTPERTRDYIAELQSLDEPNKRKVLFAAAAAAMVIIVVLWWFYFNNIVTPSVAGIGATTSTAGTSGAPAAPVPIAATPPASVPSPSPASAGSAGPGFWAGIGSGISGAAQWVTHFFTSSHDYTVQPSH